MFSEGLAAVLNIEGWGYIDKTGSWAIKPMENISLVAPTGIPDGDTHSDLNLPVRRFTGGFAAVGLFDPADDPSEWNWEYLDKSGEKAPCGGNFEEAGLFSEGLAPVKDRQSGKWGFIDTSGKMLIQPQFDERWTGLEGYLWSSEGYHEGLAAVGQDGMWGYIDKTGDWVIQPQFSYANGFLDGFAYTSAIAPPGGPTSTIPGPGGPYQCPSSVRWRSSTSPAGSSIRPLRLRAAVRRRLRDATRPRRTLRAVSPGSSVMARDFGMQNCEVRLGEGGNYA